MTTNTLKNKNIRNEGKEIIKRLKNFNLFMFTNRDINKVKKFNNLLGLLNKRYIIYNEYTNFLNTHNDLNIAVSETGVAKYPFFLKKFKNSEKDKYGRKYKEITEDELDNYIEKIEEFKKNIIQELVSIRKKLESGNYKGEQGTKKLIEEILNIYDHINFNKLLIILDDGRFDMENLETNIKETLDNVNTTLYSLRGQIIYTLLTSPETYIDELKLVKKVWINFYDELLLKDNEGNKFLHLDLLPILPTEGNIRREKRRWNYLFEK